MCQITPHWKWHITPIVQNYPLLQHYLTYVKYSLLITALPHYLKNYSLMEVTYYPTYIKLPHLNKILPNIHNITP